MKQIRDDKGRTEIGSWVNKFHTRIEQILIDYNEHVIAKMYELLLKFETEKQVP